MKLSLPALFRRKKYVVILLGIALVSILSYRQFFVSDTSEQDNAAVERKDIREELILTGEIDAHERALLQFQVGGRVTWVGVQEGDSVEENQVIATLDQRTALKSLQGTLVDYNKQRNTFESTQDAYDRRTPESALNDEMKRILQNNQYDLEKAVISVELQELARQQAVLSSPIAGIVTSANPKFSGMNISVASPGRYEIINPDSLYIKINADQTEIVMLSVGQRGTVVFDSYPDETLYAVVEEIAFTPKEEEINTVYEVKLRMENTVNDGFKYRIGMTGDITFVTNERRGVISVPTRFIKTDESGRYVLTGDNRDKKYITTGIESDTDTEVIRGLRPGEVVYD